MSICHSHGNVSVPDRRPHGKKLQSSSHMMQLIVLISLLASIADLHFSQPEAISSLKSARGLVPDLHTG